MSGWSRSPTPGPGADLEGYGLGDAPADGSVLPWARSWTGSPRPQLLGVDDACRRPPARDAGVGAVARRRGVVLDRPDSVKGRNLAARPDAVVHLESGDEVCVLDGRVGGSGTRGCPPTFVDVYAAKYDTRARRDRAAFGFYVLDARTALTWREVDFPTSATRWTFG